MPGTPRVRRSTALLVLAFVLLTGGLLGFVLSLWAGRSLAGDSHTVPVFIARTTLDANALSANQDGFAPILKPAFAGSG
jgi:hypothetical protein